MRAEHEQSPEDTFLIDFFKALAGPIRLRIAGRLAAGPATLAELATELEVSLREATRQVSRLVDLGLVEKQVEEGRGHYRLNEIWLRERAEALLDSPRSRALAGATDERARVLATFLRDGRLTAIPTGDQRKLIVLDAIARRFNSSRTYTEREVNEILKQVYEYDYVTLRRLLVDYRFLNRDRGAYWIGEGRREEPEAPLPPAEDTAQYIPKPDERPNGVG